VPGKNATRGRRRIGCRGSAGIVEMACYPQSKLKGQKEKGKKRTPLSLAPGFSQVIRVTKIPVNRF
jgi:hypothetical protein